MYPVLFTSEYFTLPTYGVLYLTAFLTSIFTIAYLGTRIGVPFRRGVDAMFMVAISGEVGSRLTFVITEWPKFRDGLISFKQFLLAGRVVLGGVLFAIACGAYIVHRFRFPILAFIDAGVTGTMLGMGIGRIGCLMAGCCYGKPTELWWGITFTNPLAQKYTGTPLGVPLHPTQIIQSLDGFLMLALLLWMFGRRKFDGQCLVLFLTLEGVSRFLVEFLRNDPRGAALGLATSQWIGLGMVVVGTALWLTLPRRLKTAT